MAKLLKKFDESLPFNTNDEKATDHESNANGFSYDFSELMRIPDRLKRRAALHNAHLKASKKS